MKKESPTSEKIDQINFSNSVTPTKEKINPSQETKEDTCPSIPINETEHTSNIIESNDYDSDDNTKEQTSSGISSQIADITDKLTSQVRKKQVAFKQKNNTTHRYFQDQDQDQEEYDFENESLESQDDDNTIDSNNTSIYSKNNMDQVVLPKFVRYQMMILLDHKDPIKMTVEQEGDELLSPAQRVREVFIELTSQIKKHDNEARMISWKTTPNYTYLNDTNFPEDVASIATYFQGYCSNLKADRRVYVKFGIQTPNDQTSMQSYLSTWAGLYGYNINKCIIQAESASYIGWLAYSTPHMDTEILREELTNRSNFEWGFKQVTVTESDKEKKWLS